MQYEAQGGIDPGHGGDKEDPSMWEKQTPPPITPVATTKPAKKTWKQRWPFKLF